MQSTSNVGNAEQNGSQLTPLERLRPYQIATMLVPGTNVQVRDASDAQFEAFLVSQSLAIVDGEIAEWSFDDRVRIINFARKNGVDLFAIPNEKSSDQEQNQFGNNSVSELIGELFDGDEAAPIATINGIEVKNVSALLTHIESMFGLIENSSNTAPRDDIDMLIAQLEKSSVNEQKEFGEGE